MYMHRWVNPAYPYAKGNGHDSPIHGGSQHPSIWSPRLMNDSLPPWLNPRMVGQLNLTHIRDIPKLWSISYWGV